MDGLVILALIWVGIHGVNHVLKRSARSLLPLASVRSDWTVVLKGLHLRVQTTRWNGPHDVLAASLQHTRLVRVLRSVYDLGSVVGVLGMLAALAFLLVTGAASAVSLFHKLWAASEPLAKRSLDPPRPIIPGITVPLAHLPLILLAVFLAQIVHELGHALAAALDGLPLLSAGLSFTLFVPSAFVTFPTATLDTLPPRARARIISAGAFHNILLWLFLLLLASTRLPSLLWSLAYKDVAHAGRVVVAVDDDSPLYAYLPLGSLITTLDDTPLASPNASSSAALWSSYLQDPRPHELSLGWCASLPTSPTTACCAPSPQNTQILTCFTPLSAPGTTHACLDPLPLLGHPTAAKRCTTDVQCAIDEQCIAPLANTNPDTAAYDEIPAQPAPLIRLTVLRPGSPVPEVIVWRGSGIEVFDEVHTSTLTPRLPLALPLLFSLPHTLALLASYLLTASLSLFFFNLLPLPYLDGAAFLRALLAALFASSLSRTYEEEEYALEAGVRWDAREARRYRWRDTLVWLVPEMTLGAVGVCVLLGVLDVYWR
ncbi:hypothetical protein H0H87_012279 [Tephrocybe sp. NHM501043]|nr:hypothetical protein H0H87_012279 [Tephrocybe sp. NHM501043]